MCDFYNVPQCLEAKFMSEERLMIQSFMLMKNFRLHNGFV